MMDEEEYEELEDRCSKLELRLENLEGFFKHFVMSFKKNKSSGMHQEIEKPPMPSNFEGEHDCSSCNGSGLGSIKYDESGDPYVSSCDECRGDGSSDKDAI